MGENVDKELACRLHPFVYALKQPAMITHVLKHFDRKHTIVALRGLEVVDIGCDNFETGESAMPCLCFNIDTLRI